MKVIRKSTGEETSAIYATTTSGNKRYNVDGKFYTDKKFNELFDIKSKNVGWRVNTPQLLREVLENPTCSIMAKPLTIFSGILAEVSERALQLNDPKLNALMCRLALFEQSDPYSKEYDSELTNNTIEAIYQS